MQAEEFMILRDCGFIVCHNHQEPPNENGFIFVFLLASVMLTAAILWICF